MSKIEDILLSYQKNNIIREQINLSSVDVIKDLYSCAAAYIDNNLKTGSTRVTPEIEMQALEDKIKRLTAIGLGSSKNVGRLKKEFEERSVANLKYQADKSLGMYLEKLQATLGQGLGMLVVSFADLRKVMAGKNYSIDLLQYYQGEFTEAEVEKLMLLSERLSDFNGNVCKKEHLVGTNVVRNLEVPSTSYQTLGGSHNLIRVIDFLDGGNDPCGDVALKDNRIFVGEKELSDVTGLVDNDLFQVLLTHGTGLGDDQYIFDFPGADPSDISVEYMKVEKNQFMVASSSNDFINPPLIFQTFLDGVLVFMIPGYDLNLIKYNYGMVQEDDDSDNSSDSE